MNKRRFVLFICLLVALSLFGCKKQPLSDSVKQKQNKIAVGEDVKLDTLFECEEGVSIGLKNPSAFNSKVVGSYSIEATIIKDDESEDHTYLIEVYDDQVPEITAEDIVICTGDEFDALTNVSCQDNSNETIKAEVKENTVDIENVGVYKVVYTATDSSGNTGEKEISVTVKQSYTYDSLKEIVKEKLKEKKYNLLEMTEDDNKELIWIEIKDIEGVTEKISGVGHVYYFSPYWSLSVKDKQIEKSFFVKFVNINTDDYLSPERLFFSSSEGKCEGSVDTLKIDYEFNYSYTYHYNIDDWLFSENDIENIVSLMGGNDITATIYCEEADFSYTYTKEEHKAMKQLRDFYNELSQL